MKKYYLLAVVLFIMVNGTINTDESISLGLMEYAPLIGEDMEGYGVEPTIVTAAFKKVNIDVEYEFFPPARNYTLAEEGVFDGTLGWVWSEEREKVFYYSEPIFTAPLVLFHLKEFNFDWTSIDDLSGIPIGITVKNYYGPEFHEALDEGKLTVDMASKDVIQWEKLLRHRIKLYPMNPYTGFYMIRESFSANQLKLFTYHPRPLKTSVYHVLLSRAVKDNEVILKRFNRGLQQLKTSGEYDTIVTLFKKEYSPE